MHNIDNENNNEASQQWSVPKLKNDNPRMFSVDGAYSPTEFLTIIQNIIQDLIEGQSDKAGVVLHVLEVWERRVIDLVAEFDDAENCAISFVQGPDKITRLSIDKPVDFSE